MELFDMAQREQEAYYLFEEKYRQMHPKPEKPQLASLDITFWGVAIVTPAQVLFAAMRTAEVFYSAAFLSSGSKLFAGIEALLAIIAIEVGLVVYAATGAKRKIQNRLAFGQKVDTQAIDTKGKWAIILGVTISVVAGLTQSLRIVEGLDPGIVRSFETVVALILGFGASIIAWIGGDVLGSQYAMRAVQQNYLDQEHKEALQKYHAEMLERWARSPERRLATQEMRQQLNVPQMYRGTKSGTSGTNMTDVVYEFLSNLAREEQWTSQSDVPSARQIEAILQESHPDLKVSSCQRGRNRWMKDNF